MILRRRRGGRRAASRARRRGRGVEGGGVEGAAGVAVASRWAAGGVEGAAGVAASRWAAARRRRGGGARLGAAASRWGSGVEVGRGGNKKEVGRESCGRPQITVWCWFTLKKGILSVAHAQDAPQKDVFLWRMKWKRHRKMSFCGARDTVRHRKGGVGSYPAVGGGAHRFSVAHADWCATESHYSVAH